MPANESAINIRNIHHTKSVHRSGGALGDTWIRNENQNRKTKTKKDALDEIPVRIFWYVFSGRSGLTSNCAVMVALPSNQMDSIFETKVADTPLIVLISKLSNTFTWCVVSYTTVYITLPWGGGSRLDCSTTKRVPIPNDASSESSRRDVSNAVLFGADTIPTVEISTSSRQNKALRPYLIRRLRLARRRRLRRPCWHRPQHPNSDTTVIITTSTPLRLLSCFTAI